MSFNNVLMNKHWSLFLADSKKKLGTKLVYYLDSLQASCFDKKVALRKWMDFIKVRKDYSGDEWELGLFPMLNKPMVLTVA